MKLITVPEIKIQDIVKIVFRQLTELIFILSLSKYFET